MNKSSEVTIIIPAFNEEVSIGKIIQGIQNLKKGYEILVVDDGSEDNTAQVAQEAGASVIRHPYNIGNGAAVKTGARNASGEIVLLMDADEQHSSDDIPKLLEHFKEYDMVVGARTRKSKVSLFRAFGNKMLGMVANYLSGAKIPDLTSGFRAIKKDILLEYLHLLPNKYSYPTTITLALLKSGYTIKYLPLETIQKRMTGKSKLRPFQDGFRILAIIVRIIMLFSPLRVFLPASFLLITLGLISVGYGIYRGTFHQESHGVLLVGILVFFFGILADQLAHIRRELGLEKYVSEKKEIK